MAQTDPFRWRLFVAASLGALALAAVSVEALPGAGFDREPTIRAMRAKADAFVTSASRKRNFGASPDLRIGGSPTFRTFVRFKANVKSDDVLRVNLMVYSRHASLAGYQVRLVEEAWHERKITFRNAPSLSSGFVLSGSLKARSWKAVDVTPLLAELDGSEKYVSFALTTRSHKAFALASRETGLHGPRLVIEREDNTGNPADPGIPGNPGTPGTPADPGTPQTPSPSPGELSARLPD